MNLIFTKVTSAKMFAVTVLILAFSSVVSSQFLNCPWVNTLNCTTFSPSAECGTDGITYSNRCYFAKEQCANSDLHVLHDGPCTAADSSTTPAPNVINGTDAVLDFFCTVLSKEDCGSEVQEVCATDKRTYQNYCEYDKARCTHRQLKINNFGPCV